MLNILDDITKIKGIGVKKKELFSKLGIETVGDMIEYFPLDYDHVKPPEKADNRLVGKNTAILIRIDGIAIKGKLTIVKSTDGLNSIALKWFNMPYLRATLNVGRFYIIRGVLRKSGKNFEMIQPSLYSREDYSKIVDKILPLYPLTAGITNNILTKTIQAIFLDLANIKDILNAELRKEYSLAHYDFCVRQMHFPTSLEELKLARERLAFQEFYTFIYKIRKMKENEAEYVNDFQIKEHIGIEVVENILGFKLTGAQTKAVVSINNALKNTVSMSRLLQGDVGSGKTVVAFISAINVALSGYQVAIMAPTEILCNQHYNKFKDLIEKLGLDIDTVLLSSSVKGKKRKEVYDKIATGKSKVIFGTNAIMWKDLSYFNLAYVITDEQHRFGVNQRSGLATKGKNPHILVMSATPIPRTLAIMLYGSLDISIIDELPKSRLPIKNKVIGKEYEKATYKLIYDEVKNGHQAYVVCPLVEVSEGIDCIDANSEYEKLRSYYGDEIKVGLLHGRMKPKEKDAVMMEFLDKKIDVLVSTTVIEVGVDVPNATVMAILDPHRFGLAQLHQLRGRVGRGSNQSYCVFLILSIDANKTKRLEILEKSNDGFDIANADLKLRGPGEFFGVRQSGEFSFKIADLYDDAQILRNVGVAIEKYGDAGLDIKDGFSLDTI